MPYYTAIDAVALLGTFEPATTGNFRQGGRSYFLLVIIFHYTISYLHKLTIILEARILSGLSENRGPILESVIKKKLYKPVTEIMIQLEKILSYNLTDIGHQMVQNIASDEEIEVQSDNGPFNNIPREILFKILSYLNLYSLGRNIILYLFDYLNIVNDIN